MSDVPPTSGNAARSRPSQPPAKPTFRHARPKSRGKTALKVLAVVVAIAVVAVAAVVGYGWYRYNQIGRDNLALASQSGSVQNFLIVGSDSRAVIDKNEPDASAFLNAKGVEQGGQRSDTIMVARVDSKNKTVDLMSFPRDLWVPIQPSGESERINTAFAQGKDSADGAQRLIDTIKTDFGIDINHYVEINFKSFKGITDAVGGIPLYFEKPVRDRNSGFYQDDTGCHTLSGDQALAYARSRHLEYYDAKTKKWIEDPSGDLGRISRQTLFMRTMLDRAQNKFGGLDLNAINGLVSSTADNLSLDSKLDLGQLVSLGKSFKGFSGSQIQTHALPVYLDMTSGGASILRLDAAAADDTLNIFRGLPPGTVLPQSVTVSVANATGARNRATEVSTRLGELGYTSSVAGDITKSQTTTIVKYAPGFEKQADLVARQLVGGAELQADRTMSAKAPVALVLGTSYTSVLPEATPATSTSTTTTAATSTSGSVPLTSSTEGPVTTIKPGEITDYVGVLAGAAPDGVVCK
jgi:LCP family protein required for cell wall assembly